MKHRKKNGSALFSNLENNKITKAQIGHIDPQTKALITTKGSKLTGKKITPKLDSCKVNNTNGQWFLTTKTKNHIHGWHFLLLSLAQSTFNYENLGWEVKEQQYTVLNTEVKCMYWLQIPKLLTPSVRNKSEFWLQYLSSIYDTTTLVL